MNDPTYYSVSMREVNDDKGNDIISEHGFGMAIDLNTKANPQIKSSNKALKYLIWKSTGFDLSKPKTVNDIKHAHYTFLSVFKDVNIDDLLFKYIQINSHYSEDFIELELLQDKLDKLQQDYLNIVEVEFNSETTRKIEEFKLNTELINNFITQNVDILPYYKNSIVFEDKLIDYIDILLVDLIRVKNNVLIMKNNLNIYSVNGIIPPRNLQDLTISSEENLAELTNQTNEFLNEMKAFDSDFNDLKSFSRSLEIDINSIRRDFGSNILKDGFCDVELSLINAFLS